MNDVFPRLTVDTSFAQPIIPKTTLVTFIRRTKRSIQAKIAALKQDVDASIEATGKPLEPVLREVDTKIFRRMKQGSFWGSTEMDKKVSLEQLSDILFYMARILELPGLGTHTECPEVYRNPKYDLFILPPTVWVDERVHLPILMRQKDKKRWGKWEPPRRAFQAWLWIGRKIYNNRALFTQYCSDLIPVLQELMAIADLAIYQTENRTKRVRIMLDFFEGHRMLPDALERMTRLAIELGRWQDAAVFVKGGLKILQEARSSVRPDTTSPPMKNRNAFPAPEELDKLLQTFQKAHDLLQLTAAAQAQQHLLWGIVREGEPEPVMIDGWVTVAFAGLESPEQIVQLAEDLFFEGLMTHDQDLVDSVMTELSALQLAPTDEMWATLMRVAKYSGQYKWNVRGPSTLIKAYSGSYLQSRALPFEARQRRLLQLQEHAHQSVNEELLCDRARWTRLRAIKRAMGYTNIDALPPYRIPTDEEMRPEGLPPLFIPYQELALARHKEIFRNKPIELTPKEHYERILRNQRRRWFMNILIRMVHGTYEYRGSRLRLLRQYGLDQYIKPIQSKLRTNTTCAPQQLEDITQERQENQFKKFERTILMYDDSQVGVNDREDVMNARDIWITDADYKHTAQAMNELRALMEHRIQVPGEERKLMRQWRRRLSWVFNSTGDPQKELRLTETLIESYRHIFTAKHQKHRGGGPLWKGKLVMGGISIPEWPLLRKVSNGERIQMYDPLAPFWYFYDPFSNVMGPHDAAESVAATLRAGDEIPLYKGPYRGPEQYLSGSEKEAYLRRLKEERDTRKAGIQAKASSKAKPQSLDDMATDLLDDS